AVEYDCRNSPMRGAHDRDTPAGRQGREIRAYPDLRGAVATHAITICSAASMAVRTIEWRNGRVVMLDQRLLPTREVYRGYADHREVARAIKDMVVRGAPAIGVAAAMGLALGARTLRADPVREFARLCRTFAATRPTAINLFWAIERMRRVVARNRHRSP